MAENWTLVGQSSHSVPAGVPVTPGDICPSPGPVTSLRPGSHLRLYVRKACERVERERECKNKVLYDYSDTPPEAKVVFHRCSSAL
ncbi:hypothetical protein J6590_075071 [Homalodisca vitripennis]|nr:hypothetical protein J6590_075071 [Homalodisca vitripennis]